MSLYRPRRVCCFALIRRQKLASPLSVERTLLEKLFMMHQ